MAELEKAGVPTVSFVARDLTQTWQRSASLFGIRELPGVVMSRPFAGLQSEDIRTHVDSAFGALMQMLTGTVQQEAGSEQAPAAEVMAFEAGDRHAAWEQM